jgi:hypothetical protein
MYRRPFRAYSGSALAAVVATGITIGTEACAQEPWQKAPLAPNQVSVSLIQQDSSDCTNTTVKDDPNRTRGGEIWVTHGDGGTTNVRVAMTVTPNTTYHFFLKCVRLLGDIRTDDEGIGMATFSFQTSSTSSTFAFDMYPEGAPAGNKFQSLTVNFK